MPFSLLVALFLAFGFDSGVSPGRFPSGELAYRVLEVLGGIAVPGLLAMVLGHWTAYRIEQRRGEAFEGLRRTYFRGSRAIEFVNLGLFGWIIHGVGWPSVVRSGLGLEGAILVDDLLIIAPFLAGQVLTWWGLYTAERALRPALGSRRAAGLGRYLSLKARQSLGLLLPILLVFSLGQDVLRRSWPGAVEGRWGESIGMAVMGLLVLVGSPLFVRLAWPTRPLPPGPLRDRLDCLARRFGFRCTDILILDTGRSVVNAGVTGTLPWFRYVFLTDALVEGLEPNQVAAVFGHEIGHIAHRHLLYFGFFFVGSIAVLSLMGSIIQDCLLAGLPLVALRSDSTAAVIVEALVALLTFGLYFLIVFGHVSRRFERQADVFGCRAVSCGHVNCPPHADLNASAGTNPSQSISLCPVGIRTFVTALNEVAILNGMARGMRSWRHGSVARRIDFLEGLEGKPESERRFQTGVSRLRVVMALILLAATLIAIATDKLQSLP